MTDKKTGKDKVTAEDIRETLGTPVKVMDKFDQDLWPLFDRLERELEQLEPSEERMDKYRRVSACAINHTLYNYLQHKLMKDLELLLFRLASSSL